MPADEESEAVPMSLFWEETVARDHFSFKRDLRFLTERKCDKRRLVYLLHAMSVDAASRRMSNVSRQDLRKIRQGLLRGAEAVEKLRQSEVAGLMYGSVLARCSPWALRKIAEDLGELEPGFDKRITRLDRIKAVLVRYVESQTGAPNDKTVVRLIDVAQAPSSWVWDDAGFGFVTRELPAWNFYTLEQHSAWRSRHKKLRKHELTFEKVLLMRADADGQRVADWLKRNRSRKA